jgi:hypothetical protein
MLIIYREELIDEIVEGIKSLSPDLQLNQGNEALV